MNYAIKSKLVDLITIYQAMGDEDRANVIGDALMCIKDLEHNLKQANEQLETLNVVPVRNKARLYHV